MYCRRWNRSFQFVGYANLRRKKDILVSYGIIYFNDTEGTSFMHKESRDGLENKTIGDILEKVQLKFPKIFISPITHYCACSCKEHLNNGFLHNIAAVIFHTYVVAE